MCYTERKLIRKKEKTCLNVVDIQTINADSRQDPAGLVARCDADFRARIREIAAFIRDHRTESPLILLSGPSGSGKTTSAKMLESFLDGWGFETHTVSLDNYFLPLPADAKVDLEAPDRVDSALLNEQLRKMVEGKTVEIPRYDFTHGRRLPGEPLTRRPDELVILEGIHALNPDVVTLSEEETVRIYVSVRTRVTAGDLVLHPKKIRLLRRMLRDKLFRGRKAADTLRMFESVQRGENHFIMPYKGRSTFDIDTFHAYEISAYRDLLLPELHALPRNNDIDDLIRMVERAVPVAPDLIPSDALPREFIGGSVYE